MSDQPHWKADYPIRQSEELRVTRRQFAKFACCSAAVFGATWLAKGKLFAPRVAALPAFVARIEEIPVGGTKLFRYPTEDDPCILVRLAPGRFAAYSQSCTHLRCPVHFNPEKNLLVCPCHEGFFSVGNGRVLAGPPPRPLARFPVQLRDGQIWVMPANDYP